MDSIIFSDIASRCLGLQINQLASRAAQLDWMAHKLKAGTISKTQLEGELYQAFGCAYHVSVETLANDLILFGFVKEEVRAEEFIMIEDGIENYRYVDVEVNNDGSVTALTSTGKTFRIYEPKIDMKNGRITGKRKIQVKRKYYTWVG